MARHPRTPEIVREHPVEVFASVLMVAVGFSVSRTAGWPGTAGGILATVGGVLLSWITAVYYTKSRAVAEHEQQVAAQMQTMSHQLGVASAQIREAVFQTTNGEFSADTCFALILQAHSSLSGLLNQMQAVSTDVAFDPDTIIETAEQVKSLGTRLSALASEQAGITGTREVDQELAALRSELDDALARLPADGQGPATVGCPECNASVSLSIGMAHGDSAFPTCPSCGYRFHAHRGADGGVFTRRPGASAYTTHSVPQPLTQPQKIVAPASLIECPDCGDEIRAEVGTATGSSALLKCPSCQARFNVHRLATGELRIRQPAKTLTLECPDCHTDQRIDVWHDVSQQKTWLCLNCLSKLIVDLESETVLEHEKQDPLQAEESGDHELLCPSCDTSGKAFGPPGGPLLAWCPACHQLLIGSSTSATPETASAESA